MFIRPCIIVIAEDLKTNLMSLFILFHFLCTQNVRVAGFSLQHGKYSNPAAPNLQLTTNREQNDGCDNSTAHSQAPDDGYINVRNI